MCVIFISKKFVFIEVPSTPQNTVSSSIAVKHFAVDKSDKRQNDIEFCDNTPLYCSSYNILRRLCVCKRCEIRVTTADCTRHTTCLSHR